MPKVLNRRLDLIPKGAVYVDRLTKWGNPYVIGKDGTREEVIDKFRRSVLPNLDVSELRGKDLVCWCAPKACHADELLKKANRKRRIVT